MVGYAEVHYNPWFVPSFTFMRQPEIICDAPSRVEPGQPVPVFIIVKDADRFPVLLKTVVIQFRYENGIVRVARFPYGNVLIDSPLWWDAINIMPEYRGLVRIDPYILVTIGTRSVTVHIDNYPGISHAPLHVYAASSSYPGSEGWYHGDVHCHTFFTSDQVEFGLPLEALAHAARCMGMHWIAATDHSYDLDDTEDDYLRDDPALPKWQALKEQSLMLAETVTVLPGEEVSCRTRNGRNCHLLALNAGTFIQGSGDSGERPFAPDSETLLPDAVADCVGDGGIACAAHPLEKIPLFEKILLKRGEWTNEDLAIRDITAMQFYNGLRDTGYRRGKKCWIELLLAGRRIYAFGGSDAHGDLNRSRYVSLPFISLSESNEHVFGTVRTVVRAASASRSDIVDALGEGGAVVTDGPFIDIAVCSGTTVAGPGRKVGGTTCTFRAEFFSSEEYGALESGTIFGGFAGETSERILERLPLAGSGFSSTFSGTCSMKGMRYLRAECLTIQGKICFTNPIWIEGF